MLANHYNDIIVGKSYISLIVAINKAKDSKVLVIDDPSVILGRGWYQYIGATEKHLLQLIGSQHDIEALNYIDNYLTEINTIIYLNDKIIELGKSPAANIRELLRKVPELFDREMLEIVQSLEPDAFNQYCSNIFETLAREVYVNQESIKNCFGKLVNDQVLKGLYSNVLSSFKNRNFQGKAKQFHFVLQVLFQTIFSNSGSNLESTYLLTSILSPRYHVNEQKLLDDLIFQLRQLGGDLKKTKIQNWEIYREKLNYILLESFEGVIQLDHLYFFGRLPETVPFQNKFQDTLFNSIEVRVNLGHYNLQNYLNKRVIFSWLEHLGSDSPHWEAYIDGEGNITGIYSYANYSGSKPEFYYNEAMAVFYSSIKKLLPGLSTEDFQFNCQLGPGRDLWMENRSQVGSKVNLSKVEDGRLYNVLTGNPIKRLEYWGPLKAKSLGLYSYLMDLKAGNLA